MWLPPMVSPINGKHMFVGSVVMRKGKVPDQAFYEWNRGLVAVLQISGIFLSKWQIEFLVLNSVP